jgi:O2-independent ubiquinone biosynthesis accessory factor UbiT
MSKTIYQIPHPVGRMLAMLPVLPGSVLFAHGLNGSLSGMLPDDLRRLLQNKHINISVTDACLSFHFTWNGTRFIACEGESAPDLSIRASTYDFVQLARRQEDPDTLFFSRRLVMEGDTELGLAVKNTLDALDAPIFGIEKLMPESVLQAIRQKLRRMVPTGSAAHSR